jgi:murein DD-endopeptidase MepM/ murein hydrolase activator NlpD
MSQLQPPHETLTVMLVPGGTGNIRRFQVPRKWIRWAGALAVGAALLNAIGAVDYVRVRRNVSELDRLRHETAEQREQLLTYAKQIEEISGELTRVSTFERKLRVIANLDPGDPLPLPGVGGPQGEGLEPHHLAGLTRSQRHTRLLSGFERLSSAASEESQSLETLIAHLEGQTAQLAATPSVAPARGWLTSGFGHRVSPFTGQREFHRGLDIAARQGTPILAPADGRVRFTGGDGALGTSVVLRHGYGIETMFGHLAKATVESGQLIKRGDQIGVMGSSGRSTGPHLHYQIMVNGSPVNPQSYILD